jgi:hypothetical protein
MFNTTLHFLINICTCVFIVLYIYIYLYLYNLACLKDYWIIFHQKLAQKHIQVPYEPRPLKQKITVLSHCYPIWDIFLRIWTIPDHLLNKYCHMSQLHIVCEDWYRMESRPPLTKASVNKKAKKSIKMICSISFAESYYVFICI